MVLFLSWFEAALFKHGLFLENINYFLDVLVETSYNICHVFSFVFKFHQVMHSSGWVEYASQRTLKLLQKTIRGEYECY